MACTPLNHLCYGSDLGDRCWLGVIFVQLQERRLLPVRRQDSCARNIKEKDKDKILPSGIAIPDYKRYAAALNTNERFSQFVRQNITCKITPTPCVCVGIFPREGITNRIEPVYPFTKLDAKELGVDNTEGNNNVIGLRINYAAKKPEDARTAVALLGRYLHGYDRLSDLL